MYITSSEETYEDGRIIFEEGSFGDWIYVVESGSVELSKKINGKKIVIEILGIGDVFGELGFIAKTPRTATARALGNTSVGILDREFLDDEFNKLSTSFQNILVSLALRLEKTTRMATQAIFRRMDKRIPKSMDVHFRNGEELIRAYSENISPGGIFINTDKPLSTGDKFQLNLFLPDDPEPLKIKCEVSWVRPVSETPERHPSGMGVKFLQISRRNLEKLKKELKTAGKRKNRPK